MEVEYVTTMDDYVELNLHTYRSSGLAFGVYILGWIVTPLLPLLVGAIALVGVGAEREIALFSVVLAIAMGLMTVAVAVTYPFFYHGFMRWFTRAFAAQRGVRGMVGRIRLILTDETLTEITESTRTEARWRDMVRVEETGDTTYIFVTGMSVALVPKHGFADEEDYYLVRDFARSHVGKVSRDSHR
jgi:hypothetical protein